MSVTAWFTDFMDSLSAGSVPVRALADTLSPARLVLLDAAHWAAAGRAAAQAGLRFAGIWGDCGSEGVDVYACFAGDRGYVVLRTRLPGADPALDSLAHVFPAADRMERHLRDMIGVAFPDHPDARRWTRHKAWAHDVHPLRSDFPLAGHGSHRTPSDNDYAFQPVHGSGVYEIPVGPVHAGIIEPGHFRFHAVGEHVLRLEERLGFVHKGIEKLAAGRDPFSLARLAGRVSGDSTVAHAWAACQAMERAAECGVPARASAIRCVAAERERIANHLGDIGAVCNDVAFAFAHVQCARLRETWQRRSRELLAHRFMMDLVVPGGVARDLGARDLASMQDDHERLRGELAPLFDVIGDHPSLEDRLQGTGRLSPAQARALGCTGYVGKASGQDADVRRDNPYSPYDELPVEVTVLNDGDVAARVQVRMDEIRQSLLLLDRVIEQFPAGSVTEGFAPPPAGAAGLGIVDGWRGETLAFVRFGENGKVARYFPRDPSWFTWPALEWLIDGNIVPDFPVCNKSVNASYSGHDL